MAVVRIVAGETERIQTPAVVDGLLQAMTGLATVELSIQRRSDGLWLDFSDKTFKGSGWTTQSVVMTETDAALAPGEYHHDFDTSAITNAVADDDYMIRADETGGVATNVPFSGELKIDQWVADVTDAAVAVDARLPADPADESNQLAQHAITQAAIAALAAIDAAAVATAVWSESLPGSFVFPAAGRVLDRLRVYLTNRQEVDFTSQEMIAYEDDGTTPAQHWDLETNTGPPELVIPQFGSPTIRKDPKDAF